MIGAVPYLNGGLFDVHELEESHPDIRIPDEAFEAVFRFFDQYEWTLDDRPIAKGNEINPDVLGYIFEKYINQKQMGAYYTKEDITGYIGKNTIVPYMFDAARKDCRIAFEPDSSLWRLLRDDPDAYLYPAMKKGVIDGQGGTVPLPDEIARGIDDPSRRGGWNRPAWPDSPENALPTETWREYAARRQRCLEVREKLQGGEVRGMDDFITHNLNIRQFAQDVSAHCEGPELLRALYKAVSKVTVLDPACGSGAFLFAALNILEPLYEACLDRMRAFTDDLERSGEPHSPRKFEDFRRILAEVEHHPNRTYFILKSIVVHNLYGVDLMEEAAEICKLRLFLKLVAQVDDVSDLEPLPDIDFNIRAGNTLVGYATRKDVRAALGRQQHLGFDDALERIEEQAEEIDRKFQQFRLQQTTYGGEITASDKKALRSLRSALAQELNRYLADQYKVKEKGFKDWLASHKPFHWFVEFHEIMAAGGFHAVIGNPPYVEHSKVPYSVIGYATRSCQNLYAWMLERGLNIAHSCSRMGMIVPVASVCTDRYAPFQRLLWSNGTSVVSNFNDRPSKLFEGLEHIRLCIILHEVGARNPQTFSTTYNKWQAVERATLFQLLSFTRTTDVNNNGALAKIGTEVERSILKKLRLQNKTLRELLTPRGKFPIFYTRKLSHFVQVLDFVPEILDQDGAHRSPSELKVLKFTRPDERDCCLALLNSSLFWWVLTAYSDCRNLNKREIESMCFNVSTVEDDLKHRLSRLARRLMDDLQNNSRLVRMNYKGRGSLQIQCTYPRTSKSIIDEIDAVVSQHLDFTTEESDFIVNYDIKYRMGGADAEKG